MYAVKREPLTYYVRLLGTDNLGKEITVFYIGNETNNMMDAIKMGFEGLYKTCFVYTRSGTAAGHKTQTNFQNALNVASSTLTLARSAPQLQTSLLVAVEPFVVELTTDRYVLRTEPAQQYWSVLLAFTLSVLTESRRKV